MNQQETVFCQGRVLVTLGDITKQAVDAVVNAANATLLGGGGVDGAIHRNGGPAILAACREIRRTLHPKGLPTGEAVITTAGNLPAQYVIHTVGPIYGEETEDEAMLLANCYRNCLQLAVEQQLATIAFPSISTGAFGYPRHEAAVVSSQTIAAFLRTDERLSEVRLVFFSSGDLQMFLRHQQLEA
ncbi:MAG: O-acetyl-ADP-ribose deacetylase [Blastocatellia bacterium]